MNNLLTPEEKKVVGRLVEAGVAASAEKLGHLSNTEWTILSSSVKEVSFVHVLTMYQGDLTSHYGAHLKSQSLLPLQILILFPHRGVREVTDAVIASNGQSLKDLPDPSQAIIGEIANILGQGIIKAMADTLKISVILGVPQITEGQKIDLLGKVLTDFDQNANTLILSHVEMHAQNLATECSIIMTVDTAVIRRLVKVAKVL